jgi:hypothetical protein
MTTTISSDDIKVLAALIGVFGVIFGAISGALSSLLVSWLTRRSEERRHRNDLALKIATLKWEQAIEGAKRHADATGIPTPVVAFDYAVIHAFRLVDIVADRNASAATIEKKLRALQEFSAKLREHAT